MNPEKIVQQQVEAYNARDIDTFVACHHPEAELFNFSETVPFTIGLEKIKGIYQDVFENSPNLNTQILNRIVFDNKVIDHEIVTGRKEIEHIELIAIYEIKEGLIGKAHFIREN